MEDYITYDQAVKLKELGFDWETTHFYDLEETQEGCIKGRVPQDFNAMTFISLVSAPTLSQAQKWLRDVKGIHIEIKYTSNPQYEPWVGKVVIIENYPEPNTIINTDTCDTYEEALSEGIDKALAILIK